MDALIFSRKKGLQLQAHIAPCNAFYSILSAPFDALNIPFCTLQSKEILGAGYRLFVMRVV